MSISKLLFQAGNLACEIARMPHSTLWDCQEQDLMVAKILDLLVTACEGNGDAAQIVANASKDLIDTVWMDRNKEI